MINTIENFFNWLAGIEIQWLILMVVFLYLMLFLQETIEGIKKVMHRGQDYHKLF